MDELKQYRIRYTETAIRDITEKADYIAQQFRDPLLGLSWYQRLRAAIQNDLSFPPYKYQLYDAAPWREKGVRLFLTKNDVVLYSIDEEDFAVIIRGICTRGQDLTRHLDQE